MTLRSALQQYWYVTVPVLAFLGWLLLKLLVVFDLLAAGVAETGVEGAYVGQAFVSGVVGLLVMGVVALLFLVLYSELGEFEPAPSAWPPEQ